MDDHGVHYTWTLWIGYALCGEIRDEEALHILYSGWKLDLRGVIFSQKYKLRRAHSFMHYDTDCAIRLITRRHADEMYTMIWSAGGLHQRVLLHKENSHPEAEGRGEGPDAGELPLVVAGGPSAVVGERRVRGWGWEGGGGPRQGGGRGYGGCGGAAGTAKGGLLESEEPGEGQEAGFKSRRLLGRPGPAPGTGEVVGRRRSEGREGGGSGGRGVLGRPRTGFPAERHGSSGGHAVVHSEGGVGEGGLLEEQTGADLVVLLDLEEGGATAGAAGDHL